MLVYNEESLFTLAAGLYRRTGDENILPVVAWWTGRDPISNFLPLRRARSWPGCSSPSCGVRKMLSGESGERIRGSR